MIQKIKCWFGCHTGIVVLEQHRHSLVYEYMSVRYCTYCDKHFIKNYYWRPKIKMAKIEDLL